MFSCVSHPFLKGCVASLVIHPAGGRGRGVPVITLEISHLSTVAVQAKSLSTDVSRSYYTFLCSSQ